jgi:hypothetical protein
MQQHFSKYQVETLLQQLKDNQEIGLQYVPEKHSLWLIYQEQEIAQLRLPLSIHYDQDRPLNYLLLLMQTGHAAIGYFEGGENITHKVFKSYLVRKKQGMSQLKYLKTRGKSKAGSRVRLGNAVDFFENINERASSNLSDFPIDRIAISCPKTIWPYLFQSKYPCPFEKKDERLFKVPFHVNTPKLEELMKINRSLQGGELIYQEEHSTLIQSIVNAD